jgi:hypothetical protein
MNLVLDDENVDEAARDVDNKDDDKDDNNDDDDDDQACNHLYFIVACKC